MVTAIYRGNGKVIISFHTSLSAFRNLFASRQNAKKKSVQIAKFIPIIICSGEMHTAVPLEPFLRGGRRASPAACMLTS